MRAIEAVQNQPALISRGLFAHRSAREKDEVLLEGGRRGKIGQAKKKLQDPEPEPELDSPADIPTEVAAAGSCEVEEKREEKRDEKEREQKEEKQQEEEHDDCDVDDSRRKSESSDKKKKKRAPQSKLLMKRRTSVDPEIERRQRQIEEIKEEYHRKREQMAKRRIEIVAEKARLEQESSSQTGAVASVAGAAVQLSQIDYTKIPSLLDEALERLDADGALRPSIINVGKTWSKRSQAGLLAAPNTKTLGVDEQKLEKNTCYDLLDALTRSGGLDVSDAALHIVVSTTHCFGRNLMDTLVKDNMNPIEKVEHTQLIVASQVFQKPASELLKPDEIERVKRNSPSLF
jgi:hypothetical protein